MAAEVGSAPSMPQLQSVQKAMSLPAVGAAVGQVGAFYTRVKGAHSLLEWALSTAEASVTLAATTAAPYVAAPLAAGDARVAAALDELERRLPLVTEQPKVIVETTKQAVLSRITPQLNKVYGARDVAQQRVKSLKELTWAKANVLLSTAYGQKAMHGVDSGASYAMQLLNHYLPPAQDETNAQESHEMERLECMSRREQRDRALGERPRAPHGADRGAPQCGGGEARVGQPLRQGAAVEDQRNRAGRPSLHHRVASSLTSSEGDQRAATAGDGGRVAADHSHAIVARGAHHRPSRRAH
ncbi:lipid storage droplets surface-binding protein 2 isoform X2 [Maniola hyperantus]|uniref:lipid storage droplets surface-binding protein 2 isoform X2 n=1 Tax=Aphantopus hyperantus TaxID=2795564 RepID=UPI003748A375